MLFHIIAIPLEEANRTVKWQPLKKHLAQIPLSYPLCNLRKMKILTDEPLIEHKYGRWFQNGVEIHETDMEAGFCEVCLRRAFDMQTKGPKRKGR